jgi:hypothetical protein
VVARRHHYVPKCNLNAFPVENPVKKNPDTARDAVDVFGAAAEKGAAGDAARRDHLGAGEDGIAGRDATRQHRTGAARDLGTEVRAGNGLGAAADDRAAGGAARLDDLRPREDSHSAGEAEDGAGGQALPFRMLLTWL